MKVSGGRIFEGDIEGWGAAAGSGTLRRWGSIQGKVLGEGFHCPKQLPSLQYIAFGDP